MKMGAKTLEMVKKETVSTILLPILVQTHKIAVISLETQWVRLRELKLPGFRGKSRKKKKKKNQPTGLHAEKKAEFLHSHDLGCNLVFPPAAALFCRDKYHT